MLTMSVGQEDAKEEQSESGSETSERWGYSGLDIRSMHWPDEPYHTLCLLSSEVQPAHCILTT